MRLGRSATAAALMLGGCASLNIAAPEAPQPPKNHRQLVLEKSATLFPGGAVTLGDMAISPLRNDEHIPDAFWSACLRTDTKGKPRTFTLFFKGETVVHVREALAVDGCGRETFVPLKPETKKPAR
jgi:hypothetical protein